MIPFKVQQARIAGDTQALKRLGSHGGSIAKLKRIVAKFNSDAAAKPVSVPKSNYLHQPDLFGYKQGSVAWAKKLMSLSPESIARLVPGLPSTTTRSISKVPLGSGMEGAVWPSFTGQHGFSATKVFYDYYSKFGKRPSDKITSAGFNQALDRAFGGESRLNFHDKAEFMRGYPDIFPKILGTHNRGYIMPLLKPTNELDVRGLIKAKLRRAGFQPERMGDWSNDSHYVTDIHPGNVMLQKGRPVIADPIVLDLKKLEKKGAVATEKQAGAKWRSLPALLKILGRVNAIVPHVTDGVEKVKYIPRVSTLQKVKTQLGLTPELPGVTKVLNNHTWLKAEQALPTAARQLRALNQGVHSDGGQPIIKHVFRGHINPDPFVGGSWGNRKGTVYASPDITVAAGFGSELPGGHGMLSSFKVRATNKFGPDWSHGNKLVGDTTPVVGRTLADLARSRKKVFKDELYETLITEKGNPRIKTWLTRDLSNIDYENRAIDGLEVAAPSTRALRMLESLKPVPAPAGVAVNYADLGKLEKKGVVEITREEEPESLWHGSPRQHAVLMPSSDHGDPGEGAAVFATPYREMALAYAGQRWGDRDINQGSVNGRWFLEEMRPGAFADTFKGQTGYIHELPAALFGKRKTMGNRFELVAREPVNPIKVVKIQDIEAALVHAGVNLKSYDPKSSTRKALIRRSLKRMASMADSEQYLSWVGQTNKLLEQELRQAAARATKQASPVGIPNFNDFSSPSSGLTRGDLVEYVLQHHDTLSRPGRPHLDLRLGKPSTGLYSWAIPKARMPKPNEKLLAPQTQVHAFNYRDFEGKIGKGYGAGSVSMADRGQALVTNISDNSVGFTLAHTKTPVRYRLVRIQNKRNGKSDWLLSGVEVGKGTAGIGSKPKLKLIKDSDLDQAIASATQVQAKIDGAHTIYDIGDKGQTEAYSYRRSVSGAPIVHTERLGLGGIKIPELANTEFRGEAYGTRDGKPLKFQEVSGILNSGLAKAITTQKQNNIEMRNVPFSVTKFKGNPVTEAEQPQVLQELLAKLPSNFEPVETAHTPEQAKSLLKRIIKGKQPQTTEGIVIDGRAKYKIRPEITGTLRGVMKDKRGLIAGIGNGPDIRLGTGFTRQELSDIVDNINEYVGNNIRIGHQGSFDSGLLRAPSYLGMEV